MTVAFRLDGSDVVATDPDATLLDVIREQAGVRSPKDGCSPQGQCGCCTVWVDGAPRVSCVTPVRRVAGREVTTVDGLDELTASRWAQVFVRTGGSQCGFCTPGIVMRLAALEHRPPGGRPLDEAAIRTALAAHLCRCTGWQTVVEAAGEALDVAVGPGAAPGAGQPGPGEDPRDPLLASWRAQLEGPQFQVSTTDTVLGRAGFADDGAPRDGAVALASADGGYVIAATLADARRRSGKVQGRNSTAGLRPPLEVPGGDWVLTLRTGWVEPAYLEPDASWCLPGSTPASPVANGGAFGGKRRSPVPGTARRLADERAEAVRVLWPREEVVRRGPKRPPVAAGVAADGTGVLRVACTTDPQALSGYAARVAAIAPGLVVEPCRIAGPPVSVDLRGAGWAEAAVLLAALRALAEGAATPGAAVEVTAPSGGRATVSVPPDGPVQIDVWAGSVLDPVVLRSYCIGAAHQALGWVRSEGIALDAAGSVQDLTVRSYGVISARDTPWMRVTMHEEDRWPVNGSDAVFAATAAAAWITEGLAPQWPTRRPRAGAR